MGHDGRNRRRPSTVMPGWRLFVICAVQMMVILDGTIVNIALPSIQHQLHFSAPGLEWVITAYALTFGGLLLLGGRSGDLFGRRRMFAIGVVIFTAASLLGGFATDQAVADRGPGRPGRGGCHRLAHRPGADPEHLSPRASALACHGRLRGHVGGGWLARAAARRHPDRRRVVAMGAVRERAHRYHRGADRPAGARHHPRPAPDASTYPARCRSRWAWRRSSSGCRGPPRRAGPTSFTVGGAGGGGGPARRRSSSSRARARTRSMPLRIFSDRNRAGSYVIMLCLAAAMFATFFFITQFVQNVLGYSPLQGRVRLPPHDASGSAAPPTSSRAWWASIGPRRPMTVGPLLVAGGTAVAVVRRACTRPTSSIVGPLLLLAIGMGSTFVPLDADGHGPRAAGAEAGLASALLNTGQQIGGVPRPGGAGHGGHSVTSGPPGRGQSGDAAAPPRARDQRGRHERLRRRLPDRFRHRPVAFILAVTVLRGRRQGAADMAAVEAGEPEVAVA